MTDNLIDDFDDDQTVKFTTVGLLKVDFKYSFVYSSFHPSIYPFYLSILQPIILSFVYYSFVYQFYLLIPLFLRETM